MKHLFIILLPALLSGCSYYNRLESQWQTETLRYQCDEGPLVVQRDHAERKVTLEVDDALLALPQGLSASGERFSDGVYVFWSNENTATVYRHDRVIRHDCLLTPEDSIFSGTRLFHGWSRAD